jgi:hypothetical protein
MKMAALYCYGRMGASLAPTAALAALAVAASGACGALRPNGPGSCDAGACFPAEAASDSTSGNDASSDVSGDASDDVSSDVALADAGPDGSDAGYCTSPLCMVSMTDDCAGKGLPFTSITGVVYDPAGTLPLYDVVVYIPSSVPEPIDPGNPTCTPCEAVISGGPIVIDAITDERGQFTLVQSSPGNFGVPSGENVPLVIQTGKWRKQVTIPNVAACTTTAIPDPVAPASKLLRLPVNSREGDMPIIALTSGCDPAECFLRHIGISDSEFVAPTAPLPAPWAAGATPVAGAGHVRFYTGRNAQADGGSASSVAGGNTAADTYEWWTQSSNLLENDIIFDACECSAYDRGTAAYSAMDAYLNGGGQLFTTHDYYNWFAAPTGTPDLQSVAAWDPNPREAGSGLVEMDSIDQTFPKGLAFAAWLQESAITTTLGTLPVGDYYDDVNSILPMDCEADGTCLSTQWIYSPTVDRPRYLSFNTPVGEPMAGQCGRAVFTDVHLTGISNNATFPAECADPDPTGIHTTNEKALEFLFFDLSTPCGQQGPGRGVPPGPPK